MSHVSDYLTNYEITKHRTLLLGIFSLHMAMCVVRTTCYGSQLLVFPTIATSSKKKSLSCSKLSLKLRTNFFFFYYYRFWSQILWVYTGVMRLIIQLIKVAKRYSMGIVIQWWNPVSSVICPVCDEVSWFPSRMNPLLSLIWIAMSILSQRWEDEKSLYAREYFIRPP